MLNGEFLLWEMFFFLGTETTELILHFFHKTIFQTIHFDTFSSLSLFAYMPFSQWKTHFNCYFWVILWPVGSNHREDRSREIHNIWPNRENLFCEIQFFDMPIATVCSVKIYSQQNVCDQMKPCYWIWFSRSCVSIKSLHTMAPRRSTC